MSWFPLSTCGSGCLPEANALPTVGPLRRAARYLALAVVLTAALVRPRPGLARLVLRAAGVKTPLPPEAVAPGTLVVANHTSWIDVIALVSMGTARRPVRMLAKREITGWPVIGRLARRLGTLFVDRGGLRTLPGTVDATAAALRSGASVGVFPEATTWCLPARDRFRRAPFQAAIDAGARVAPVTLWFTLADGRPTTAAAFLGEDTFLGSLRRVVRTKGLVLHIIAGTPFPAIGDRKAVARRAESAVMHEALVDLVAGVHGERAVERAPALTEADLAMLLSRPESTLV